ncbi:MAG: hypothetical protein ACM3YE_08265 [Bacteroidota bacterium]
MACSDPSANIVVHCIFLLGTPPRQFAVMEKEDSEQIIIQRVSETVFSELQNAGIPLCEPVAAPPASLAGLSLHCVFQANIGAQEPVSYVVAEDEVAETVTIVQISTTLYSFLRQIGISSCRYSELIQ